jgi:hypothetical protein
MVSLVHSVEDLIDNITRFSKNPARYGGQLWDSPGRVRGWYAIRDAEGRWIYGPSRVIGYDRQEMQNAFVHGLEDGYVNGGATQKHLKKWTQEVQSGEQIYDDLWVGLSNFLAHFSTKPGRAAKIYVLNGEAEEYNEDDLEDADDMADVDNILVNEANLLSRMITTKSRSASVRTLCIEHHGHACSACSIEFGSAFGSDFANLIDVHHSNPLAQAKEARQTDPVKDCVPLCPNCHRMAHYGMPRGTCRSLKDLKKILKKRAS